MIISGGFKEFNSALTKTQNPDTIELKISQKIASLVLKSLLPTKFKVFRNPSQPTAEFQKLWRGFCRLSKNH